MGKYPGYRIMETREHQLLQLKAMQHIHDICVNNDIKYYIIAGSILGAVRHGGFIPWDDDIDIALMRDEYERFKDIFEKYCDKDNYFLQDYTTDSDFRPAIMRVCIKNTILDAPETMHHNSCHNTYLDVFPLDNAPDDLDLRKQQAKRILELKNKINSAYYFLNPENKGIRIIRELTKRIIAAFYSVVYSKKALRRKIVSEMTLYRDVKTQCVCSMASGYSYERQTMPRDYYGVPTLIKFEDTEFYGPEKPDLYLRHLYGDNYMTPKNKFKNGKGHDVYIKE